MDERQSALITVQPMNVVGVVRAGLTLALRNYKALIGAAFWGMMAVGVGKNLDSVAERLLDRDALGAGLALSAASLAVGGIGGSVAFLATARLCGRLMDPWRDEGGFLGRLVALVAMNVIGALAFLPLLVLLPLGILVWVRWSVAEVVVALEETGPIEALAQSWRLVRGSWWHTLGVVVVAGLVLVLGAIALGVLWSPVADGLRPAAPGAPGLGFLRALVAALPDLVIAPFGSAIFVVLYHDLRARAAASSATAPGPGAGAGPAGDRVRGPAERQEIGADLL